MTTHNNFNELNELNAYILGIAVNESSMKKIFDNYHIPFQQEKIISQMMKLLNTTSFINFGLDCLGELKWYFLRGYIDAYAKINSADDFDEAICKIECCSDKLLQDIHNLTEIPNKIYKNTIIFLNVNMTDFLGKVYEKPIKFKPYPFPHNNYMKFQRWLNKHNYKNPICQIIRIHEDAILPFKTRYSDVGLDLVIIREEKKYNAMTTLYDTGIALNIPYGYYAEIVPRSSLSKSGYMLANSVGIIDNSYRGNLYIPLIKIDPNSPEIKLPFRCCQLIFKKQYFVDIEEVSIIERTGRGQGGFGSTG